MGAAAFWIFLAAIIIAGTWRKNHSEALKHETLRFLVEKNQKLDEAQLAQLLNPPPPPTPDWMRSKPGGDYRALRIFGTIVMFIALGLIMVCIWRGAMRGFYDQSVLDVGTAIPLVAMLGIGLFVASHFVAPLPPDENKDK